jgi:glucose/arabinose dehydrogenase
MPRELTRLALSVGVLTAGVFLASCSDSVPTLPGSATPTDSPSLPGDAAAQAIPGNPQTVTEGLEAPWSIVFLNGTPIISERDSARLLELGDDGTAREVGVVDGVVSQGESGLLGLAIDDQNRLYVYSTAADGNRIQRFNVTGVPGSLGLGAPQDIISGIPSASYHDGGRIAFGPDGMLYAAVGDAGRGGAAQDPGSNAGKILRMTPDGSVPDDNPDSESFVYSSGHRNPQGLAWTDDGTLFATEFGQNTWDELNIIVPGGNYGWPTVEGIAGDAEFVDPVQQWKPEVASPSGMAHANGTLYIANLRGQVLRAVPVTNPTTSTDHFFGEYGRIRDVTTAPDGRLWFATSNTDGRGDPAPGDDLIIGVDLTLE